METTDNKLTVKDIRLNLILMLICNVLIVYYYMCYNEILNTPYMVFLILTLTSVFIYNLFMLIFKLLKK